MKVCAIILTFNEQLHLARCIDSIRDVCDSVYVVDCLSTDTTVDIAKSCGARVLQNPWVNYATQFNWALRQVDLDIDWVIRIDADEVLSPELRSQIQVILPSIPASIDGIYVDRRMKFLGQTIRYGGIFPVQVLRLVRRGRGECENRWMDEHIKVSGPTARLKGEILDDNLNTLTWWIDKHNKYASREVVDLLNLEYSFMPHDTVANLRSGKQDGVKRWLKEKVYVSLPLGMRALVYFVYRYVVRLGFLDGYAGTAFHFLQGFWYRYLVDAKLSEVKLYMRAHNANVRVAIYKVLGIQV